MKITKTSLLIYAPLWLWGLSVSAQDTLKIKHSCNFYGQEIENVHYIFDASDEAQQIVDDLLKNSGLSSGSFILKESNCANALATLEGKKRYILYNPLFLQKFKQDGNTKWAAYCVLAHEIAHHLNNHDLEETDPAARRRFELEADKYAGYMLFRMKATLEEAQLGIETIPLESETNTHPSKTARKTALANGWMQAKEEHERLRVSNIKGEAEKARGDLFLEMPTVTMLQTALSDFTFETDTAVTIREARKILDWLSVSDIQARRYDNIAEPYLFGALPSGYEIAIWVGTYQMKDRYGIRFGNPKYRNEYISSNDTYFELKRK